MRFILKLMFSLINFNTNQALIQFLFQAKFNISLNIKYIVTYVRLKKKTFSHFLPSYKSEAVDITIADGVGNV